MCPGVGGLHRYPAGSSLMAATADLRWQLLRLTDHGSEVVANCATTAEVLAAVEKEPGLHIQGAVPSRDDLRAGRDWPHIPGSVSADMIKSWLAQDAWTDADELREVAATVERVLSNEGVGGAAQLATLVAAALGENGLLNLRYENDAED